MERQGVEMFIVLLLGAYLKDMREGGEGRGSMGREMLVFIYGSPYSVPHQQAWEFSF